MSPMLKGDVIQEDASLTKLDIREGRSNILDFFWIISTVIS